MARQRTQYKLIGRYMNGKDTIYYVLVSEDGKEMHYSEEQMAFLVGREQVVNVSAQLYKNKILFRGVGCNINELPIRQINEHVTKNTNKCNIPEKAVRNKCNIIESISICIDKAINSGKYILYDEFSISKKIKDNKLIINILENSSSKYVLTLENINNQLVISLDSDKIISLHLNKIKESMNLIFSLINLVPSVQYKNIVCVDSFNNTIKQSFEEYSANSYDINYILMNKNINYVNPVKYHIDFLNAMIMELQYIKMQKLKQCVYNGYLFRAQNICEKTINQAAFTSTTLDINTVKAFAGDGKVILAFHDVDVRYMLNMGNASYYKQNMGMSEHEILIRAGVNIKICEEIGNISGTPLHLATIDGVNASMLDTIYNRFMQVYNSDIIYCINYILKNLNKISSIKNDNNTLYFKTKSNNIIKIAKRRKDLYINDNIIYSRDTIINTIDSLMN